MNKEGESLEVSTSACKLQQTCWYDVYVLFAINVYVHYMCMQCNSFQPSTLSSSM